MFSDCTGPSMSPALVQADCVCFSTGPESTSSHPKHSCGTAQLLDKPMDLCSRCTAWVWSRLLCLADRQQIIDYDCLMCLLFVFAFFNHS